MNKSRSMKTALDVLKSTNWEFCIDYQNETWEVDQLVADRPEHLISQSATYSSEHGIVTCDDGYELMCFEPEE